MDSKKEKLLKKTYASFIDMVLSDVPLDHIDKVVANDVMGFGTTVDEKIHDLKGLRDLAILQREQSADMKFNYEISPVFRKTMNQHTTAIIVDEIKMTIQEKEEKMELQVRLSTILHFIDGNWKVVHWHGSKPEYDAGGTDTWHREEWKKKNEELQQLVEENTADLIIKNRELEIETALEKVRAVAMGMQKPDDILDVCKIISGQLEKLNISDIRNTQVAVVNDTNKTYLNYQYFTPYSKLVFEETEYENNPTSMDMVVELQKSANSFFTGSMKGKELEKFKNWRKKYNQFPDPKLDDSPELFYYFYSIGHGGLGLTTYKEISKTGLEIFKRFHKVFKLAYQRYIDIEKAKAQAREAQIEAALERVRSRSMAMHKSEELADLSLELVKQVQALGVATWFCAFNIYDEAPEGSLEWGSNGQGTFPKYRTPREGVFLRYYEAGQSGKTLLINEIDENECPGHYEYLCSLPGVGDQLLKMKNDGIPFPTSQIDHAAFFKYGYILFITFEPAPEAHDIFKRFAKVFEQTYTRFLDLQKAEAQAREAQIELALERVRARAMSMQKSDELSDLVGTVFTELSKLEFSLSWCIINIIDEPNRTNMVWGANTEAGKPPESYFMKFEDYRYHHEIMKAYQERMEKWVFVLEGDEKRNYDDYLFTDTEFRRVSKKVQQEMRFTKRYVTSFTFCDFGGLQTIGEEPLSEENLNILNRFGKVFDLTYTRFNDLLKAEAQAREARIETVLERVRSRSMGMQKSEELQEVIQVVYDQFIQLDILVEHAGFIMDYKIRDDMYIWLADKNGAPSQVTSPYFNSVIWNRFIEAKEKGKGFFAVNLTFEEKNHHYEQLFKHIPELSEEAKDFYFDCPGLVISTALMDNVCLYIENFKGAPFSIEENNILKRFGKVFQQTYTRFLDLKKAEAQARGARIEAALEKVRSRSIGMQKSEELKEVIQVIHDQLIHLNFEIDAAGFTLDYHQNNDWNIWIANKSESLPSLMFVPYIDHPQFNYYKSAKEKGLDFLANTLSFEEKNSIFKYMFGFMGDYPQAEKDEVLKKPGLAISQAFLNNISLWIYNLDAKPYSKEENNTLMRFAKVFQQTYTRFLDLKKSEEQTREAQIEAVLEKVRSRTMAMQQSEEMPEVANNLFLQVKDLGFPAWSAGYCIWENDKNSALCSMSSEGVIQKSFSLPTIGEGYDFSTPLKNDEQFYLAELGGEALVKHYNFMRKLPIIGKIIEDFKNKKIDLPTFQIWHIVYFKHGYLMFITYEPVPEAHDIFKRFAKVFEQTYTRFLDLKKAEEQARESQIEAALEKVRSRSLAMQTADELGDVVNVIVEKLTNLGVVLDANGVVLCTYFQDSKDVLQWIASSDFSFAGSYLIPYFDHPIFNDTWQSKDNGEEYFSKAFSIEEKNSFFEYAFEHSDYRNFPDDFKQWVFQNDKHILSFAWQKHSAILIPSHTGVVPSESDVAILKRFAKVFEQAYVRFMDLQKTEAQARETQVELSLERIRAKVTAMQESTDLLDIVVSMRTEFVSLGHEAHYFWYMRWLPEKYEKAMTSGDGTKIGMVMTLPRHIHGDIKLVADWEKSDEPSVVLAMDAETAVDYIHKMITLGDFKQVDPQAPTLDDIRHIGGLTFVMARTKHGEIGFSLPGTVADPPKASLETLVRFAGVFDLAYSRFEDLKAAERSNRETQIELALERSRNQSMLMQYSNELNKTSEVFHEQLELLGIDSEFSYLWLPDEPKKEHLFWATWHENKKGKQVFKNKEVIYSLDKTEPSIAECYTAWESGVRVHIKPVAPDGVEEYFATWDELLHGVEKFKPELFSEGIYYVDAYMKYGCFGIMIKRQITTEEEKILGRFAVEFERAYTRFLDLKKAEEQTREAIIETALEKVRSRTMAMQKGEELKEVVVLLYKELIALGVTNFVTCGYVEINEKINRQYTWVTSPGGDSLGLFYLPLTGDATFDERYAAWKQQQIIFHQKVAGEVRSKHLEFAITTFNSKEAEEMVLSQFPDPCVFYCFNFSHGYLHLVTGSKLKNEEELLLARFTRVFEQTYARFLDLQKAEEQARKAQIETALERVRARAMAMQEPEELMEVAEVMRHEMGLLGVEELETSSIYITGKKQNEAECWFALKGLSKSKKKLVSDHFKLNFKDTWVGREMLKFYKSSKKQVSIVMTGEPRIEWIRYCEKKSIPFRGYYGDVIPDRTYHLYKFSHGAIGAATAGDFSEENWGLLKKAASVFSLAYARFNDLTKARHDLIQLKEEKKRAENALTELRSTQSQLIHAEKMASLGELTAGIAHEIQNPLNFINNFSEVNTELIVELNEEIDNGDLEEAKAIAKDIAGNEEKIIHHGKRADGIVKGMLQHSRSNTGLKEAADINALADEYLRLAYHGLRAKDKSFNAKMETDFDDTIGSINIIPQDMGRVILNLITNAFYAVNEKKKSGIEGFEPVVTVSTKKEGEVVIVSVKDNGNGIPQHVLDKIFQPFFTTKPTGQGTGLGLSMSYDIITKGHSGSLNVVTKEGEFTEFTITLPK